MFTSSGASPARHHARPLHGPGRSLILIALTLLGFVVAGLPAAAPAAAAPATVVTLTFDDGNADLMTAVPILKQNNLKGTFYIISGSIGAPNYMTRANLSTIAADGNEIGGHTVSHPDLTTVPLDEAKRQICNDRVTLSGWGFTVKNFAYPYTAFNSSTETVASDCGYNSARTLGDIASAHGCAGCETAGPIPPPDPFNVAAVDEIDTSWTLAQMKAVVTTAERTGGWVPFTFHHICTGTGCDSLSITTANFSAFLAWLKTRPATTSVKTVDQVIGGPVKPLVSGPPVTGVTAVNNPSLETLGTAGFPSCWMPGGYGTNTVAWTRTADAHTGGFAERLDVSGYASGDAKLLPTFDLGSCSPAITAGQVYTLSAWYKSTAVTQFTMYYRDGSGGWFYWTSSPWFAAATAYTQAVWTTPAAPAGATGISFGLNLFSNGSITTDDYSIAAGTVPAAAVAVAAVAPVALAAPLAGTGSPVAVARINSGKRHARTWGKRARPTVIGGPSVRQGTRIDVPFLPD